MRFFTLALVTLLALAVKAQITSPQNFTLGCGSKSVCTLSFAGLPNMSYTLTGPGSNSLSGTYDPQNPPAITVPGTWTASISNGQIVVSVPFSVLSNTFAPYVEVAVPIETLNCKYQKTQLVANSTVSPISFEWLFMGVPGSTTGAVCNVSSFSTAPTMTLVNTYTLIGTDTNNGCKSQTVVTIYQDFSTPTVNILSPSCPDPTIAIVSIVKVNGSSFNSILIPPSGASIYSTQTQIFPVAMPGEYTLQVSDDKSFCPAVAKVTVPGCVSLSENPKKNNSVSISPNPHQGSFSVRTGALENGSILVFNSLGELVKRQPLSGESTQVNLQDQASGIYVIHVLENEKRVYTLKSIKH